jgi:hypothetical protein
MTGQTASRQGVIRHQALFQFREMSLGVRGERYDDFTGYSQSGELKLISALPAEVPEILRIQRVGQNFHFRETWPMVTNTLVFSKKGIAIPKMPMITPGGEHSFDMPMKDGATFDWDGTTKTMPAKPGITKSYHFILHAKQKIPGQRKVEIELIKDAPAIKQTKADCWATVATMMVNWKEKTSLRVEDVLHRVNPKFRQIYDKDTACHRKTPSNWQRNLA